MMTPGLSYLSLENGLANTHPLGDALAEVEAAGFGAMELSIAEEGLITTSSDEAACAGFRETIDASGLIVESAATGLSWAHNPVSNDPEVRERSLRLHEAALERTAWLGCGAMLMVPGVVGSPLTPGEHVRPDHAMERVRVGVKRLLDTAERVNVDLCLENVWNGMFTSALEFRDFVDSIGSERLGVYFDVGNTLGYHQHPPHWIELLGHRIKRVHVKGFKHDFDWEGSYSFCALGAGDVPWPETLAALREIGYEHPLIAEMLPHKPGQAEATAKRLRGLLDAAGIDG